MISVYACMPCVLKEIFAFETFRGVAYVTFMDIFLRHICM